MRKLTLDPKLIISLLLFLLLPSCIFVVFQVSSLAIGLLIAALLVLVINQKSISSLRINPSIFLVFLVIFALLLVFSSYVYFTSRETKPLFSLLLFIVMFSAIILAKHINKLNYQPLANSILVLVIILIFLGWAKLFFPISCCNYHLHEKPVFPFSEESHYALALGLLAVSYSIVARRSWLIFIGANMFALALTYPSLALLLFAIIILLVSTLRLDRLRFSIVVLLIPLLMVLLLSFLSTRYEYFSSRLNFRETNNITTLVYLHGWQLAQKNLVETKGMGLGFQSLGLPNTHLTPLTDLLYEISGKQKNIYDGGFLAAKVIAEFGFVGVLLSLFYFIFILRFVFHANKTWRIIRRTTKSSARQFFKKELLLSGIVFAFFIEFFFRGYGYFSPGLFIVAAALFAKAVMVKRIKLPKSIS